VYHPDDVAVQFREASHSWSALDPRLRVADCPVHRHGPARALDPWLKRVYSPQMAAEWKSVKVWINAFIPLNVEGYTKPVPKGPYKDLTMIPGPTPLSDCFLTDQRGFSPYVQAKSRMHCEARVNFLSKPFVMTQYSNCDYTTECDCEDGDEECKEKGSTKNMNYSMEVTADRRFELRLKAHAWNPCSPSSAVGGEIDMQALFAVDLEARTLRFTGVIDAFPAFEAYATINDGAGIEIFTKAPPKGNTVMNLPGDASFKVDGVELYDPGSGMFMRRITAGLPRFTPLAKRIDLHDVGGSARRQV
jgi:hypothetical protein